MKARNDLKGLEVNVEQPKHEPKLDVEYWERFAQAQHRNPKLSIESRERLAQILIKVRGQS